MLLKRGLIRLWIAVSGLWVAFVMFFALGHTIKVFDETSAQIEGLKSGRIDTNGWEAPPEPNRSVLPSKDPSPEVKAARILLIAKEEQKRKEALTRLVTSLGGYGLISPLALLALGFIAAWVIAGFCSYPKI